MRIDWDKLRVFHAAAKAGSFTHAAAMLNLSQSAISRQVSALEREVGVPLFQRHARGLILTDEGEMLYRTATEFDERLNTVAAELNDSTERPQGTLRITTTVGLGAAWLTDRLPEFMEAYPDIKLQLILSYDELDLTTREADCAIRLRQPRHPDLIQRKLFTVRLHLYASPAYLERYGTPKDVSDLDQHRIITFGKSVPAWMDRLNHLEMLGRPAASPRTPSLQINDLLSIKRSVARGAGIAILPDYMLPENSELVRVLSDIEPDSFDTFFCYPEALKNQARLVAFRDFLLAKSRAWIY